MFTLGHILFMIICAVLMAASFIYLFIKKPSLKDVLTVCCVICVASEVLKIGSTIEIVPSADGTKYYPFMEHCHVPLHLCSIHLFTIFYARFGKECEFKQRLLGFMFPTMAIGAAFAIILPSILSANDTVVDIFTNPLAYQTFIYHSMLIVLGVYIFYTKRKEFTTKNYWYTMLYLGLLGVASIYVNSLLATPVYKNGDVVSVEDVTNFFFTYKTPIGIALTEKWMWFTYIGILIVLAFILIGLFYLPIFIQDKKKKMIVNN